MTTWRAFRAAHPDGRVLAPPGGESEVASDSDDPAPVDYDTGPYDRYFEMAGFGLDAHRGGDSRAWGRDDLDPKTVVLGVERDGDAFGFPLPEVEAAGGAVTSTVGDSEVLVVAGDAGLHAFERPAGDIDAVTGVDLTAGTDADGQRLTRLPARRLFAFAWQDDHGSDSFWFAL
ncbi:DUF3179 domain-containing (seleno)protein [Halorarius litoreus]|uniref:DUF3179 domain-containing (seleno)protein n=1 Tax=Halorarius litoreus TaxID=2962676 RepID=UPI0020CD39BE|nr:DUF3179 domain-containing (seleno)protein [Halorarius litoreus]